MVLNASEMTVRVVGEVLAGVLLVARGMLGLYTHLFSFKVLVDLWLVGFGVLAVCLELRRFQTGQLFQAVMKQYAKFLTYPVGRAVFYLLIGVLMLSRAEMPDLVVGGVVTALAISLLVSAKRISRVFNELHSAKYTEGYIMDKFYEFDGDKSGELDSHELAALCKSLGATLSKNELEVLFVFVFPHYHCRSPGCESRCCVGGIVCAGRGRRRQDHGH